MVIQKYLTKTNYTKGVLKKNEYIVLHYTANNGDTAWGNCNYFYKEYRGSSAHYFVDEHSIWQCVEDGNISWGVGLSTRDLLSGKAKYYNGARNSNCINIEMCSRKDQNGNYYFKPETVENTTWLVKYLMNRYKIDVEHVVTHYRNNQKALPRTMGKKSRRMVQIQI